MCTGRDRGRGTARVTSMLSAAVAGALLLVGCASTSTPTAAATSTVASTSLSDLTQAFLAYAQCARTHGLPDLPDPVVDVRGNDTYPGYAGTGSPRWPESVLTSCAGVWDHVHQVRAAYDASHGLATRANGHMSAAQALAFSRCIRQHGFPTYPDPGPDGTITNVPPGFDKRSLSEAAKSAIQACDQPSSHG